MNGDMPYQPRRTAVSGPNMIVAPLTMTIAPAAPPTNRRTQNRVISFVKAIAIIVRPLSAMLPRNQARALRCMTPVTPAIAPAR